MTVLIDLHIPMSNTPSTAQIFQKSIDLNNEWFFPFLPTAYVVRGKVIFWHVSVHPSIHPSVCPHLGRRGTPARSRWEGTLARSRWGYLILVPCLTPPQVPPIGPGWGGGTLLGGTHLGYSPSDLARGTLPGVPYLRYPIGPGQGVPYRAYPTSGIPSQIWPGSTLQGGTLP